MEKNKARGQRLDKNGRPYPDKKQKKTRSAPGKARPGTPKAPAGPQYPMDWFFLHRELCDIGRLKAVFARLADIDLEVWPELQIAELSLSNGNYVDFEYTPQPPQEPALLRLMEEKAVQTLYYVSVEPCCGQQELELLRQIQEQSGGFIVVDDRDMTPLSAVKAQEIQQ